MVVVVVVAVDHRQGACHPRLEDSGRASGKGIDEIQDWTVLFADKRAEIDCKGEGVLDGE